MSKDWDTTCNLTCRTLTDLKAALDRSTDDHGEVCKLLHAERARNAEATALLDEAWKATMGAVYPTNLSARIRDFLSSRAPAQPAAPSRTHMGQPWPEPTAEDRARGDYGIGFAATAQPYVEDQQPAAPEPSAEFWQDAPAIAAETATWPEWKRGAATEPSAEAGDAVVRLVAWVVRNVEDLADAVGNDPDLLRDMALAAKRVHGLSRSAEAQLAAVREHVREALLVLCDESRQPCNRVLVATRELQHVSPPSPSAAKETP